VASWCRLLKCANWIKIRDSSTSSGFIYGDTSGIQLLACENDGLKIQICLRLTPVYAAILAFLATIWPHVGTGPDWNFVQRISKSVRENFWAQIMYLNNYVNPHKFTSPAYAFAESWYLACDMQMFWISPLFIYPLWRWKRAGLIWTAFSLLVVLGCSATVFIVHNLPATIVWLRP
jgi:peptidoglycan/LPS O-acetylase OafA/YrhL